MGFDFVDYKKDFPLLMQQDVAYLDSAATAQRPASVLQAEKEFYEQANANPLRGLYELGVEATDRYEAARERVRKFLNARSGAEIIFTRNTTESINLVAYSYALNNIHAGDEIVITIMEHHSNLIPWQQVCRETGAKLVYLYPTKTGQRTTEEVLSKVGPKTKILAVGQVSNVLGVENPVKNLGKLVHKYGGYLVVDGAQSLPHMPVNVADLGADQYYRLYCSSGFAVFASVCQCAFRRCYDGAGIRTSAGDRNRLACSAACVLRSVFGSNSDLRVLYADDDIPF